MYNKKAKKCKVCTRLRYTQNSQKMCYFNALQLKSTHARAATLHTIQIKINNFPTIYNFMGVKCTHCKQAMLCWIKSGVFFTILGYETLFLTVFDIQPKAHLSLSLYYNFTEKKKFTVHAMRTSSLYTRCHGHRQSDMRSHID